MLAIMQDIFAHTLQSSVIIKYMKEAVIFFIILSIFSVFAGETNADSSSSVTVNNSVNSSSHTDSTSNCHTTVHMETNGKEQNYESGDCGDVHIQSNNGDSTINVTNKSNANTITSTPTIILYSTVTPTEIMNKEKVKQQKDRAKVKINEQKKQIQKNNFLEEMQVLLKKIFSIHIF